MIFHEEEKNTIVPLSKITATHPSTVLTLTFNDGESYDVIYHSEGESGDFEAEPADEYYEMYFDIIKTHQSGSRRYNDSLCINYKQFPTSIALHGAEQAFFDAVRNPQWIMP